MISYQENNLEINGEVLVLDYPIKKILQVKEFILVLLDPDLYTLKFGQFPNLKCYCFNGDFLWTADLPTHYTGDSYYNFFLEDGKLIALSTRSFSCEIQIQTGKILNSEFYK